ncbi:hypothetical protein TELCIR_20076, partial [Teladorsagia circumcincta]
FVVSYTDCDVSATVGVGVEFMKSRSVDVVLGPPCPKAAMIAAHLSTTYRVPWIGWGYVTSAEFSTAKKFPFATTISPTSES